MTNTNNILIVNRYTCPIKGKITIKAHEVKDGAITKSYSKMSGDDLTLFSNYETVIVCDVVRSQNLSQVNIINQ